MTVRKYTEDDFEKISKWALSGWGTKYVQDQFPQTGFIIEDIAAVFLYSTDSTVCFIENMISNKESDFGDRQKAIDLLIHAVFNEAKELGFSVAYATTDIGSVIAHSLRHECEVKPKQTLLIKQFINLS